MNTIFTHSNEKQQEFCSKFKNKNMLQLQNNSAKQANGLENVEMRLEQKPSVFSVTSKCYKNEGLFDPYRPRRGRYPPEFQRAGYRP